MIPKNKKYFFFEYLEIIKREEIFYYKIKKTKYLQERHDFFNDNMERILIKASLSIKEKKAKKTIL